MAESWKPLPKHTKYRYEEYYAKLILEKYFPERYSDLKPCDRPDLRDKCHNAGIEVTAANDSKDEEAWSLFSDIHYLPLDEETKSKKLKKLENLGCQCKGGFMTGPGHQYPSLGLDPPPIEKTHCSYFIDAVIKKLEKLNSGKYADLSRYDLFVESQVKIEDWMCPKLLEKLIFLSTHEMCKKVYTFIYLFALNGLFEFDLNAKEYKCFEKDERLWGLSELARKMAEEGSTNE